MTDNRRHVVNYANDDSFKPPSLQPLNRWFVELDCGHGRLFTNTSCYPPSKAECDECECELADLRRGEE